MPQSEINFSVQEFPEGGYQARALGFSIFTQADTRRIEDDDPRRRLLPLRGRSKTQRHPPPYG